MTNGDVKSVQGDTGLTDSDMALLGLLKSLSPEMKEHLLKQTLKKYFFKSVSKFLKIQRFFIKNKKVLASLLPHKS